MLSVVVVAISWLNTLGPSSMHRCTLTNALCKVRALCEWASVATHFVTTFVSGACTFVTNETLVQHTQRQILTHMHTHTHTHMHAHTHTRTHTHSLSPHTHTHMHAHTRMHASTHTHTHTHTVAGKGVTKRTASK